MNRKRKGNSSANILITSLMCISESATAHKEALLEAKKVPTLLLTCPGAANILGTKHC
jgi:hypothetical protein